MSDKTDNATAIHIRDHCLCFAAQRAARVLARRFDRIFAPLGLTNTQFSLMMMLNQPKPPLMTRLAPALGMDRTTLTAAFKALERRGLARVQADDEDRRGRRALLTTAGLATLAKAVPLWFSEHAALEDEIDTDADRLRAGLAAIV